MRDYLKTIFTRWLRNRKRAAISEQLEQVYALRRACDERERHLMRQHEALSAQELRSVLPTRRARGWM